MTHERQVLGLRADDLHEGLDSEFEDKDKSLQYPSRRAYPVYTTSQEQHIPIKDSPNEQ